MKKQPPFSNSFRFKVTAVMIILMMLSAAAADFAIYKYSIAAQLNQLRDKLMMTAQAVAMLVDADNVLNIPLDASGVKSQSYESVEKELLNITRLIPSVAYIYILKKTKTEGVFKFVIDLHPVSGNAAVAPPAYPGDGYYAARCPELAKGLDGPAADRQPVTDKWGSFLSGYAPIRDNKGIAVAVLGIDMSAEDVRIALREVRKRAALVFLGGILLALMLGTLVSGRVTNPVKELVKGTRRLSSGDLKYRVEVSGPNELRELAHAFNTMGKKLHDARRDLLTYFYRAVQSLARVLEARDTYTKGHSDRVAEYSEKTAVMMGLPDEKVQLIKEAALLHDIGKLGIQDMILHKKAALTDEDRKTIQKHPVIGEEILKPVSLDKEMLAVVRNHHERYDGKGYPDKLKNGEIDILAAIVSVADAYDAMTSHRDYRPELSRVDAVNQLKKNSGTQFDPAVVDAFLKVLHKMPPE